MIRWKKSLKALTQIQCDTMKLYKNRYCIALYENDDDTFFTTFDNIYEFVKFQGKF